MNAYSQPVPPKHQAVFIGVGVLASLLLVFVFSQIASGISANVTYEATLELRKDMLKETVENFAHDLDLEAQEYKAQNPEASDEQVEEAVKQWAHEHIYEQEHEDGAYMWVQKVLDFDGGDGYAVRLIHPNLSDTEGSLLSTNEVNQAGTRAYEEELEGVKREGAVFLTYDFKKLNSDEVTRKITYSKLYEPFNWIVCMGVNIDDLDHYRAQAEEGLRMHRIVALVAIAAVWAILLFVMSSAYKRRHVRAYEEKNRELREKLDLDPLTGANSRDFGERLLEREFSDFQTGKRNTLLLMMDVDLFKRFNDTHGHDFGDKVLCSVVETVQRCIGEAGNVVRWGGDEFVVVLHDVEPADLPATGDKILGAIRAIDLPELGGPGGVTSSMGFTYFDESDTGVGATLNRADAALYRAKANGRNNWQSLIAGEDPFA